jgi:class 3 adenylate cyclase
MVDRSSTAERLASGISLADIASRGRSSPDGAMTILFTDIEGSTELVDRLGDRRWMSLLRTHNRIVREHLADHDGLEVKHQGDGFMLAFDSSRRALRFAIDLQRAFARHADAEPAEALSIRIGIHTGFVIREMNDFFGKEVIVAARIVDLADGGEILVSDEVRDYTATDENAYRFGPGRTVTLKGLSQPHVVHGVAWNHCADRLAA